MIDGTDNNDDVVGGSLINISQDAVAGISGRDQSFFGGIRAFGFVGHQCRDEIAERMICAVRLAFFERDRKLQGLPATFDRSQTTPPFDRQQYSLRSAAPLVKDKLFAFGAFEYRNQDGAVLVGTRDVPNRRITRGFALAPLDDLLLNTPY